jgi:hypothetical protein
MSNGTAVLVIDAGFDPGRGRKLTTYKSSHDMSFIYKYVQMYYIHLRIYNIVTALFVFYVTGYEVLQTIS